MNKVIIIYGPTAVGKSAIAVELAKMTNGEIISADSMQIYKNLNVGSAKVTQDEMQGIKHYLIDIKEPKENYSVAEFCADCKQCIKKIFAKGKTPIIVGGTGLYIKGLIEGYNFCEVERNDEFRKSLEDWANEKIFEEIIRINDSIVVDKNNRQRLIRALEKLKFGVHETKENNFEYDYKLFGICDDRDKIYQRINTRVDKMVDMGLLNELNLLISQNIDSNCQCMKAIGYKELLPFVNGEDTLDNCLNILKQKTRNYAKRQFTFMNQFEDMVKINFCGIKETANKMLLIIEGKTNE